MEYPIWLIPGASKGFIMAVAAVIHVFVSQFAVGGGIYLVWMERKAHKENSPVLLDWLQRYTFFFLLLTMVFGALTGVAIWFTISVINPAATSTLIHIFVWIWAAEWIFFLLEVVALLLYHYSYPLMRAGKMTPKQHLNIGYLYAIAGFMSLVLINGVICFMLTPGQGLVNSSLFDAFFNPTFFPSLVFRTALCLLLAGMWALFMSGRVTDPATRRKLVHTNSLWVCLPFFVLLLSSFWYFFALPADRQAAFFRHSADIYPFAKSYGWILVLVFLLGVLAYTRAEKLKPSLAVVILCTGLGLVCAFEMVRETSRRPWVIPDYIYSSSVRIGTGEIANQQGIAAVSGWLRLLPQAQKLAQKQAQKQALASQPSATSSASAASAASPTSLTSGQLIFAQQCGTCHAVKGARIDILPRIQRFTPTGLRAQIRGQGTAPLDYMPHFYGNTADLDALLFYLQSLNNRP